MSTDKQMNLDTDLVPFLQINSKFIIDLNAKHRTIRLSEVNIGENPDDLVYGDENLNKQQQPPPIRREGI